MLQELAGHGSGSGLATASLLFFFALFVGIVLWVLTRPRGTFASQAKLPFEGARTSVVASTREK